MKLNAIFATTLVISLNAPCLEIGPRTDVKPEPSGETATQSKAILAARAVEKAYADVIRKALPAYVFIDGGSGVVISADGYVLTNHHVVRNTKKMKVRVNGKYYSATTEGIDPDGDIALLKLKNATNMTFLEFTDTDNLKVGQRVFAIGNPFGTAELSDDPTVTSGIISSLHRFESDTRSHYTDAIQTDASVNPGNSGGPLVTMEGKLAGINGLIETKFGNAANTGVALAIPVNQIARFLPKLKVAGGGKVMHGRIVGLKGDLREEEEGVRDGAKIKSVDAGSVAEKLGLKEGDKITKINDYKLLNFPRYLGVIGNFPAGTEVKLTYERDGVEKTINARLQSSQAGVLGLTLKGSDAKSAASNKLPAIVESVTPNSVADKAGVKASDRVVEINGEKVGNIDDMRNILKGGTLFAGDAVKLKVVRGPETGAQTLDLQATLEEKAK